MNEKTFDDRFFFRSGVFALLLFYCLHFCILSHLEIIRCTVTSLIATSTYFLLKYNWKRKLKKYFLGVKVWVPKPVYRSPKRADYVTALVTGLIVSNILQNSYFRIKCQLSKNTFGKNALKRGSVSRNLWS